MILEILLLTGKKQESIKRFFYELPLKFNKIKLHLYGSSFLQ